MTADVHVGQPSTLPEAVETYLDRSGLRARGAKAFTLTGDASDRRYFRVIQPSGERLVIALHTSAFDFQTLPFVNVARLLAEVPLPRVPHSCGRSVPEARRRHRLGQVPSTVPDRWGP